jgi:hypothetical protein
MYIWQVIVTRLDKWFEDFKSAYDSDSGEYLFSPATKKAVLFPIMLLHMHVLTFPAMLSAVESSMCEKVRPYVMI